MWVMQGRQSGLKEIHFSAGLCIIDVIHETFDLVISECAPRGF
jgi:hypothetical protein